MLSLVLSHQQVFVLTAWPVLKVDYLVFGELMIATSSGMSKLFERRAPHQTAVVFNTRLLLHLEEAYAAALLGWMSEAVQRCCFEFTNLVFLSYTSSSHHVNTCIKYSSPSIIISFLKGLGFAVVL